MTPAPKKPAAEPSFHHTPRTGVEALLQGIANETGLDPDTITTITVRARLGTMVVATKNRAVRALRFKDAEVEE